MSPMCAGIVFGLLCAGFVAFLGFTFVSQRDYANKDTRDFARRLLLRISTALAVFGFVMANFTHGLPFFIGWGMGYIGGLIAYFAVRYRMMSRK